MSRKSIIMIGITLVSSMLVVLSSVGQDSSIVLRRKGRPAITLQPSGRYKAFAVPKKVGTSPVIAAMGRGGGAASFPEAASLPSEDQVVMVTDSVSPATLKSLNTVGADTQNVYSVGGIDVIATRELIVRFNDAVTAEEQASIASSIGTQRPVLGSAGRIITVPTGRSVIEVANQLNTRPDVDYAEPNFITIFTPRPPVPRNTPPAMPSSVASTFPSDNLYSLQWALKNTLGVGKPNAHIHVEPAWRAVQNTSAIVVAVLDEGVDQDHPDLKDKIVRPYDAISDTAAQQPNDWDPHGTACAGIISASTNNGIGIAGAAVDAKIMPVRIAASEKPAIPGGSHPWVTTLEIIARGIVRAVDAGADVLNNSWNGGDDGGLKSVHVEEAFRYAITNGRGGKGAVVVISAGNLSGSVEWPATLSATLPVITVAATNQWDELKTRTSRDGDKTWGSNSGPEVSVAAPGVDIVTTDIRGAAGFTSGDYAQKFYATSSAAPHVAGVAALLLAQNPGWTTAEVRDKIVKSVDPVTLADGSTASYGRLNACKALDLKDCTAPLARAR